jgi:hypothetical protein
VLCTSRDGDEVGGISLIDGSQPRSCSLTHCGVVKMEVAQAVAAVDRARAGAQATGALSLAWVREVDRVKRDLLLMFHEQIEYSGVMGALDYSGLFDLPYWEYLGVRDPDPDDAEDHFLTVGCLIMILAMAWDQIDGSGNYLTMHLPAVRAALRAYQPPTTQISTLLDVVHDAVETAATPEPRPTESLDERTSWANRVFVVGYYRDKVIRDRPARFARMAREARPSPS